MDGRLPILDLVRQAWRLAGDALRPAALWLAAFCLSCGAYRAAGLLLPGWAAWMVLMAAFVIGVKTSLAIYKAQLPEAPGRLVQLVHANLATYMAYLFIGVFIGFFLMVLPGILLEASGRVELGPDTPPDVVENALRDMMPTPYGAVLVLACAAGGLAVSYLGIRLLVFGAATVSRGETMVFRTWPWTKGHALRLAAASVATHVAPFLGAVAIYQPLAKLAGQGPTGSFASGTLAAVLLVPFLLAGHGLAVAALQRLEPEDEIAPVI